MYLVPGDSPMGFACRWIRFPGWSKSDYPFVHEMDPMGARAPLPERAAIARQRFIAGQPSRESAADSSSRCSAESAATGRVASDTIRGSGARDGARATSSRRRRHADRAGSHPKAAESAPADGRIGPGIVRTALCVEVRGGVLRVFMPPLRYLDDYLELIAAVEDTAADLQMPVLVEGYTAAA